MPSVSKNQQKFMGIVHAMQIGKIKPKGNAGKVAKTISKSDAKDFASTPTKGLPKKVKKESVEVNETLTYIEKGWTVKNNKTGQTGVVINVEGDDNFTVNIKGKKVNVSIDETGKVKDWSVVKKLKQESKLNEFDVLGRDTFMVEYYYSPEDTTLHYIKIHANSALAAIKKVAYKYGLVNGIKKLHEGKVKEDLLGGGLANGKKPEDFDQIELTKGIRVEMEHTADTLIAREIAMDHLTEDPNYYIKLAKMESDEINNPKEDKNAEVVAKISESKVNPALKLAFEEGQIAYGDNEKITNNPYPKESSKWKAWMDGWFTMEWDADEDGDEFAKYYDKHTEVYKEGKNMKKVNEDSSADGAVLVVIPDSSPFEIQSKIERLASHLGGKLDPYHEGGDALRLIFGKLLNAIKFTKQATDVFKRYGVKISLEEDNSPVVKPTKNNYSPLKLTPLVGRH